MLWTIVKSLAKDYEKRLGHTKSLSKYTLLGAI